MNDNEAILQAMAAARHALEYQNRRFDRSAGWQDFNPDEAIILAQRAAQLADIAPTDHHYETWHVSEYDDPAMMEVDPDAFVEVTPPWGCGPDDPLPDPKTVIEWYERVESEFGDSQLSC